MAATTRPTAAAVVTAATHQWTIFRFIISFVPTSVSLTQARIFCFFLFVFSLLFFFIRALFSLLEVACVVCVLAIWWWWATPNRIRVRTFQPKINCCIRETHSRAVCPGQHGCRVCRYSNSSEGESKRATRPIVYKSLDIKTIRLNNINK